MVTEDELDDVSHQLGLNLDRMLVGLGLADPHLMIKLKRLGALGDIHHPFQLHLDLENPDRVAFPKT